MSLKATKIINLFMIFFQIQHSLHVPRPGTPPIGFVLHLFSIMVLEISKIIGFVMLESNQKIKLLLEMDSYV